MGFGDVFKARLVLDYDALYRAPMKDATCLAPPLHSVLLLQHCLGQGSTLFLGEVPAG